MQRLRRPFRDSIAPALAGSVLLHCAAAIVLWQLPTAPAAVRLPENYVPIALRAVRALPTPEPFVEPPGEPAPEPEPEPESESESESESDTESAPDPAPAPADRNAGDSPQRTRESERAAQSLALELPGEADDDAGDNFRRQPLVAPEVDFDATHEIAIARVVESLRAASSGQMFSTQDLPDSGDADVVDRDGDGSELDVFARAAQLKSNGAMTTGRAGSRLGRAVADLCNQLTGGFSIFGMVNVCADPVARADLFGHLRPEYMESLPLCTAEENLELQVEQSGSGAIGSIKCVLVPRAVREAFYRRYDPALAGWLPAEDAATDPGPVLPDN